MDNKNNKTIAIVLGIFALVIVTTAASFAFFTYSRVGTQVTTVTSGDIEFSFIEGKDASFVNAFPVSDSVGAKDTTGEYTFDVNMKSTSTSNKMNYDVWLVDNNNDENINYFNNEQIKFSLVKNGTYVAGTSGNVGVKLSKVPGFAAGERHGEGIVLEDQEISSNVTDTYKLRIWISDDVNYSNDIDNTGTMTGIYNSYKYSLKVKVTSGMTNSIEINEREMIGRTVAIDIKDTNGIASYAITDSSTAPTNDSDWTSITDDTAKSNIVRTATNKITEKTINHKFDNYGIYYVHVKNDLNQVKSKRVNVNVKEITKDTSGAATPVIKGDLVPVIMNGSDVIKADTSKGWYNYDESIWANAVILTDNAPTYNNGDMIKEEHIESYFVWIPRYRYKIFDEGKYTSLTSKENAEQPIEIEFETNNVEKSTGSTFGTWLTHPAFTSFDDNNGIWVAKFESGYKGATSTSGGQVTSSDYTKLVIKPNQYSWRNNTVGNMFKVSYEYNRELDSHMMKNTEWGAVAYLSHSKYGNIASLRINNNINYITGYASTEEPTIGYKGSSTAGNRIEEVNPGNDGQYTVNYYNTTSVVASTTNNYSGVYDMSGGAYEFVMGNTNNTVGSSVITSVVSDFYTNATWVKYYDKYQNQASQTIYNNRILGDATGEMGPFFSQTDPDGKVRNKSNWYGDYANFSYSSYPWFVRGGNCNHGAGSGVFAFSNDLGSANVYVSFRVVLTPTK